MATSGFKIKVGLDSTAAERGLSSLGRSAGRLNKRMGRLAGTGLKFGAGLAAASAAMATIAGIKFISDSSKAAADFEKMGAGFEVLLGSAEKAEKRLAAIQKMSMATPFEPKELIAASKTLQALGGDTAAIGDGLNLVGDAAAATGKDLQTIADNVGLLFQGLTAGGEVTEAGNQLMKMGALLPDVKKEITDLVAEMRKGDRAFMSQAEALELIQTGFVKTAGGMERLSETVHGKASTMRGNLDMLKIAFGTGINEGLVTGLDAMNQQLPKWMEKSKALGDSIGIGISEAIKGNTELLELQIAFLMQKLAQIGGAVFIQALGGIFRSLIPGLIEKVFDMPGMEALLKIAQPGTWLALKKLETGRTNIPEVPLSDIIDATGDIVGIGDTEKKIDELVRETKMTNQLLANQAMKHDKEGAVNAVYKSLVYAD